MPPDCRGVDFYSGGPASLNGDLGNRFSTPRYSGEAVRELHEMFKVDVIPADIFYRQSKLNQSNRRPTVRSRYEIVLKKLPFP